MYAKKTSENVKVLCIATSEFSSTHFARWMVKKLLLLCLMYVEGHFFCYLKTFGGLCKKFFFVTQSFKFF